MNFAAIIDKCHAHCADKTAFEEISAFAKLIALLADEMTKMARELEEREGE